MVDCFVSDAYQTNVYIKNGGYKSAYLSEPKSISFLIRRDDTTLLSILNQTIALMPSSVMQGALSMYATPEQHVSFKEFISENAFAVIVIVVLTALAFMGVVYHSLIKSKKAQKEMEYLNRELEVAMNEAKSANAAKSTFLFNMSHDIRTPMNAITGFRDLLEKHQEEPEKRQDYLDKMKMANEVLVSIINNVLEMTRIEQGSVDIDLTAANIEQFCDGLNSLFREMMEQKHISFTNEVNVEHDYVFADIPKTRDIYINLISNAYKYTNDGGHVHLKVEEIPSEKEGYAHIKTVLTDDGIGMDEDFLPHIFEPFSRENNTTDAKVEGTGLGMPIVKRLIDLLEGTIDVQSKKGVGTSITITAYHKIAKAEDVLEQGSVQIDTSIFKGKRILLAEDNELNAEIATEILKDAGFIVDRAEDGKVCVKMFKEADENYYDLILMDIQMPNMNGYEAAVAIRKFTNPIKANIPIVAMTANAFEEDKKEALRCGMNGHLAKPINIKSLMVQLTKIINKGR
ncbi:MAG: response regulator [Erysipelotrichaceae bacterium]|nr:response regulator [Erysipelotrichaceae bacterium]